MKLRHLIAAVLATVLAGAGLAAPAQGNPQLAQEAVRMRLSG